MKELYILICLNNSSFFWIALFYTYIDKEEEILFSYFLEFFLVFGFIFSFHITAHFPSASSVFILLLRSSELWGGSVISSCL